MEKQINQRKLLEFIMKALSKVEGEKFYIKQVDLCSHYWKFSPNHVVVAHMFIIGNISYFERMQPVLNDDYNHTDFEYSSFVDEDNKALLLRYNYRLDNEKPTYKFKFNRLVDITDYPNIASFPYLIDLIAELMQKTNGRQITDEDIELILNNLPYKEVEQETNKEKLKRLNKPNKYLQQVLNNK